MSRSWGFLGSLALVVGLLFTLSIDASRSSATSVHYNLSEAERAELDQEFATSTPEDSGDIRAINTATKTKTPTPTRTPTPINVGNFVWDDLDQDGRQDAGEPGLAGVVVQLWNSTKTLMIDTDTTDSNGIYQLVAPTPGSYRVRVVLPSFNDQFTVKDNASAGDTLDSDINPSGTNLGFTDTYVFASNLISIVSIDAGIIKYRTATPTRTPTPINIGNFVWDDLDQDGRQDAGEPGLAGVTVQLWNSAKTQMLDQKTTNASGNYTVVAPLPGDYRVRIVLPSAFDQFTVKDNATAGDTLDSDFNPTGTNFGFTDIISIASNVISIASIDGGIIKFRTATPTRTPTPINIGNFVWNDLDQDGVQDAGEPGLNGITVQLWNSTKTVMYDQKVTNASGIYTVVAPLPGDYRVRVLLPAGASFTIKDSPNATDTTDSDINTSIISTNFGYTNVITIASNVISISSIDAGIKNVSATPTYTKTFTKTPTKSPTPTATATDMFNLPHDALALYGKSENKFAFIDTLENKPDSSHITKISNNAPIKGKFIMGDWNGDGRKTPGLFKSGMFWYTNSISASATWSNVWMGDFDKYQIVAGRFSVIAPNDCFGIVHINHGQPSAGYPLYFTCDLSQLNPPNGLASQWLNFDLPGSGKVQFIAGDWDGDGIDTIGVRRAGLIEWSNIVPTLGTANPQASQQFGMPLTEYYGDIIAGDWNGNGIDTFGLWYKQKGKLYYRDDLLANQTSYLKQKVKKPVGIAAASAWRPSPITRVETVPVPTAQATAPASQVEVPTVQPTITPTPFYFPTILPSTPSAERTVLPLITPLPPDEETG
ncbi:MAG: hypothetical protein IPM16_03035 [Chloroflexi bacterium]|nr:hypothetical protein [Chloroflexota bacterium]